ncbi:MAG: hypothetical protein QY317_16270 [Candidatus Jettenia caeni]|nr:MAG: hypothetical protein QY317_16270 [Candidatus Jettenia caeni]
MKINKIKIAINLIEKAIEDANVLLQKEATNKNYAAASVHEGRATGLMQALSIIKACTDKTIEGGGYADRNNI